MLAVVVVCWRDSSVVSAADELVSIAKIRKHHIYGVFSLILGQKGLQ